MLLKEGGNIFKDPETKEPLTQRINKEDVIPTLQWLEKITNLPHEDFMLGTTGKKDTSGDLDVAVNQEEVTKDDNSKVTSYDVIIENELIEYFKKIGFSNIISEEGNSELIKKMFLRV